MIAAQDAISIPIIYIETFVMIFVAFFIGYIGAALYAKSKIRSLKQSHHNEILILKNTISNLKADLDSKANNIFRKDRMDQDLEQANFKDKEYSEDVVKGQIDIKATSKINFDRIGIASASQSDDLQQISGIGPFTASKLNDLGIYTFSQISKFNDEDIKIITKLIKFFPDRIKNDRWVSKAKALSEAAANENTEKSARLKKI